MACPTCGGIERSPIAPGYWRCTSSTTTYTSTMVLEPTAPKGSGIHSVVSIPHEGSCGVEYQEGAPDMSASPSSCVCGTFAIGLCRNCQRPVCGSHSALRSGSRLCGEHREQFDKAESERAAAAKVQAEHSAADAKSRADSARQDANAERVAELKMLIPKAVATLKRASNSGHLLALAEVRHAPVTGNGMAAPSRSGKSHRHVRRELGRGWLITSDLFHVYLTERGEIWRGCVASVSNNPLPCKTGKMSKQPRIVVDEQIPESNWRGFPGSTEFVQQLRVAAGES